VAATVAAGIALANPASAVTPTGVTLTPSSATAYTNSSATYTVTTPQASGDVLVELTSTSTAVANPLSLTSTNAAAAANPAGSAGAWTDEIAITTDSKGSATFQAASTATGTVNIIVGAGTDDTAPPSTNPRATGTLTVLAQNAGGAAYDVTKLAVTPTSVTQYATDPAPKFTVTASNATNSAAVGGVTVNYQITKGAVVEHTGVLGGVGATTGLDGTVAGTIPSANLADGDTVTFWVDNAVGGTSGTLDANDTKVSSNLNVQSVTVDQDSSDSSLTTPKTLLPAGQAATIPFTLTLTQTNATTHVVSPAANVKVALDAATSQDGKTTRYTGTTNTSGVATINVPVTALQASAGEDVDVTPFLSESSTATDGVQVGTDVDVAFEVPAPSVKVTTPIQAVEGGTVTVPVKITDQFGSAAGAGDSLSYSVSGGGNTTSGTVTVGSNGTVNVTYTDTGKTGANDTVTVSDLTHPAYDTNGGHVLSATVSYVTSLAPATVTWTTQPAANADDTVSSSYENDAEVTVTNASGQALYNVPVRVTTSLGYVCDDSAPTTCTDKTGASSVTVTTTTGGHAWVDYGSTKVGKQTLTATAGSVSKAWDNAFTYDAGQATTVKVTGPKTITPGDSAKFTATSLDQFGNPVPGDYYYYEQTGAGAASTGSANYGYAATDGTFSVLVLTTASASGAGAVQFWDTDGLDPATGQEPTATAKYTVAAVSKVAVAGASGATAGKSERVAVSVWPNQATTGTFTVSGANSAMGTVTTGADGRANIFYTPTKAGTDVVTVTVDGVSGTATVKVASATPPSSKPDETPVLGAASKAKGTVNIAVQTHPVVGARKIKLYYVHKVHGQKATLVYAGSAVTNGKGRAHAVLRFTSGSTVVLKARMAGSDYVEHLSAKVAVVIK
jgi:hypothetical protein